MQIQRWKFAHLRMVATAICCRECIRKWHKMQPGKGLSQVQQDYLVDVIMTWIQRRTGEYILEGGKELRVTESCAECLYDKQKNLSKDENYLKEIKSIIDNRGENDTSPYLVYRFHEVYEKYFGKQAPYKDIEKKHGKKPQTEAEAMVIKITDTPLIRVDYDAIKSLRIEAVQKLKQYRPISIGQASRISGVSPADISVLLVYMEQFGR